MDAAQGAGRTRMNTLRVMAAGLAVGTIAACAQPQHRWQHPERSQEVWASDEADCRRRAFETVDRELRVLEESRAGRDLRSPTYTAQMDRFEAQRRQARLFERCMIDMGYARVAVDE